MNMTKRGGKHLRTLLIHGIHAVVMGNENNSDGYLNQWINKMKG
ncbi:Antirestriction protein [Edwardsiella anguillarum]|uniref:Uncharacterized protein n=1 Tax=Edwardsiella anguillarum ET080813 TaxID=667120 RepID=A0A076LTF0_9GAMM|nr:Hypothetical protein ETEE_3356 [Edwardsiella anguillarum ET080813]BET80593.1 Antirestriction protein [Edwardsiella anguillarum]BET83882.1 Antirestriction protein [Edwardsiella anguillarum]BET87249.1 Antirestriction protein [Edwardsiella anguillarum]BET90675.1 Antirestriction protein [Edwardsiella anguillarum]